MGQGGLVKNIHHQGFGDMECLDYHAGEVLKQKMGFAFEKVDDFV